MSKNNSQQKSIPDALIRHQQVGEPAAALLRVRTGTECPERKLRVLRRDSSLNCGIARERELTWEKL